MKIASGLLFVSALVAFINNLFHWNYNGSHPTLELILNILSVIIALSNVFNCISYRNLIMEESQPTHVATAKKDKVDSASASDAV